MERGARRRVCPSLRTETRAVGGAVDQPSRVRRHGTNRRVRKEARPRGPARTGSKVGAMMNPIERLRLELVESDLLRLEVLLGESVVVGDAYLDSVTTHLIYAGGKRLRPMLAIASATGGVRAATEDDLMGGYRARTPAPGVALSRRRHGRSRRSAQRRQRERPLRQPHRHRRGRLPHGALGGHFGGLGGRNGESDRAHARLADPRSGL